MHPQAPEIQRAECGLAFWAGAATLFYSILNMLDEDEEPTADDLACMEAIHKEIERFASTFDAEVHNRHGGRQ